MNPTVRLKLSSIVFAVLWTGGMLWWSGSLDRANVIAWTICGALVGYFWYLGMHWISGRRRVL